jgi:hypothetical protein
MRPRTTSDFGALDAGKDVRVILLCIHKGKVGGFDFISHLDISMKPFRVTVLTV